MVEGSLGSASGRARAILLASEQPQRPARPPRLRGLQPEGFRRRLGFLAPDIEWRTPPNVPDPATWRGRDQVLHGVEGFLEAWTEFRIEVEDLLDAGERVVAIVHYKGRGSRRVWRSKAGDRTPTSGRCATGRPSQSRCSRGRPRPSRPCPSSMRLARDDGCRRRSKRQPRPARPRPGLLSARSAARPAPIARRPPRPHRPARPPRARRRSGRIRSPCSGWA